MIEELDVPNVGEDRSWKSPTGDRAVDNQLIRLGRQLSSSRPYVDLTIILEQNFTRRGANRVLVCRNPKWM